MNRRWKYIAGLVIIGGAFGYLVWTAFRASFQYTLTTGELLSAPPEVAGKAVKVAGLVEEGSLSVAGQEHRFRLTDGEGHPLPVHYRGLTPNTFREGVEVVVSGTLDASAGTFEATQVLAKCASKYQARGDSPETIP